MGASRRGVRQAIAFNPSLIANAVRVSPTTEATADYHMGCYFVVQCGHGVHRFIIVFYGF
ncbi:MAG: hypothetical protein KME38_25195 [Spirirestis rafaelensis WJT71-NPBG6]|nr:hypothetical protein [Spirirestis rafaelensis WJT71-NPBG6]